MPNCALQSEWAPRYEVNARCRLGNQFPPSSFKWSIFFVSRCELHHGPFNSMGQLEIPSCLILTAGMLVCVVTSSLVRVGRGRVREWMVHTVQFNPGTRLSSQAHPPCLFLLHPSFLRSSRSQGQKQLMRNFQKWIWPRVSLTKREGGVAGGRPPPLHRDHLLLSPDWPWQNNTLKTHQSKLWSR